MKRATLHGSSRTQLLPIVLVNFRQLQLFINTIKSLSGCTLHVLSTWPGWRSSGVLCRTSSVRALSNASRSKMADIRRILQRGLEVIRAIGNHGMDLSLVVHLARTFANKSLHRCADGLEEEAEAFENQAAHYWEAVLTMLATYRITRSPVTPSGRLFCVPGGRGATSLQELRNIKQEAKMFLAVCAMNAGYLDEAAAMFSGLTTAQAAYYMALVMEKMAQRKAPQRDVECALLQKERAALQLALERGCRESDWTLASAVSAQLDDLQERMNLTSEYHGYHDNDNNDEPSRGGQGDSLHLSAHSCISSVHWPRQSSTPKPDRSFYPACTPPEKSPTSEATLEPLSRQPRAAAAVEAPAIASRFLELQLHSISLHQELAASRLHEMQEASQSMIREHLDSHRAVLAEVKRQKAAVEHLTKKVDEVAAMTAAAADAALCSQRQNGGSEHRDEQASGHGLDRNYSRYETAASSRATSQIARDPCRTPLLQSPHVQGPAYGNYSMPHFGYPFASPHLGQPLAHHFASQLFLSPQGTTALATMPVPFSGVAGELANDVSRPPPSTSTLSASSAPYHLANGDVGQASAFSHHAEPQLSAVAAMPTKSLHPPHHHAVCQQKTPDSRGADNSNSSPDSILTTYAANTKGATFSALTSCFSTPRTVLAPSFFGSKASTTTTPAQLCGSQMAVSSASVTEGTALLIPSSSFSTSKTVLESSISGSTRDSKAASTQPLDLPLPMCNAATVVATSFSVPKLCFSTPEATPATSMFEAATTTRMMPTVSFGLPMATSTAATTSTTLSVSSSSISTSEAMLAPSMFESTTVTTATPAVSFDLLLAAPTTAITIPTKFSALTPSVLSFGSQVTTPVVSGFLYTGRSHLHATSFDNISPSSESTICTCDVNNGANGLACQACGLKKQDIEGQKTAEVSQPTVELNAVASSSDVSAPTKFFDTKGPVFTLGASALGHNLPSVGGLFGGFQPSGNKDFGRFQFGNIPKVTECPTYVIDSAAIATTAKESSHSVLKGDVTLVGKNEPMSAECVLGSTAPSANNVSNRFAITSSIKVDAFSEERTPAFAETATSDPPRPGPAADTSYSALAKESSRTVISEPASTASSTVIGLPKGKVSIGTETTCEPPGPSLVAGSSSLRLGGENDKEKAEQKPFNTQMVAASHLTNSIPSPDKKERKSARPVLGSTASSSRTVYSEPASAASSIVMGCPSVKVSIGTETTCEPPGPSLVAGSSSLRLGGENDKEKAEQKPFNTQMVAASHLTNSIPSPDKKERKSARPVLGSTASSSRTVYSEPASAASSIVMGCPSVKVSIGTETTCEPPGPSLVAGSSSLRLGGENDKEKAEQKPFNTQMVAASHLTNSIPSPDKKEPKSARPVLGSTASSSRTVYSEPASTASSIVMGCPSVKVSFGTETATSEPPVPSLVAGSSSLRLGGEDDKEKAEQKPFNTQMVAASHLTNSIPSPDKKEPKSARPALGSTASSSRTVYSEPVSTASSVVMGCPSVKVSFGTETATCEPPVPSLVAGSSSLRLGGEDDKEKAEQKAFNTQMVAAGHSTNSTTSPDKNECKSARPVLGSTASSSRTVYSEPVSTASSISMRLPSVKVLIGTETATCGPPTPSPVTGSSSLLLGEKNGKEKTESTANRGLTLSSSSNDDDPSKLSNAHAEPEEPMFLFGVTLPNRKHRKQLTSVTAAHVGTTFGKNAFMCAICVGQNMKEASCQLTESCGYLSVSPQNVEQTSEEPEQVCSFATVATVIEPPTSSSSVGSLFKSPTTTKRDESTELPSAPELKVSLSSTLGGTVSTTQVASTSHVFEFGVTLPYQRAPALGSSYPGTAMSEKNVSDFKNEKTVSENKATPVDVVGAGVQLAKSSPCVGLLSNGSTIFMKDESTAQSHLSMTATADAAISKLSSTPNKLEPQVASPLPPEPQVTSPLAKSSASTPGIIRQQAGSLQSTGEAAEDSRGETAEEIHAPSEILADGTLSDKIGKLRCYIAEDSSAPAFSGWSFPLSTTCSRISPGMSISSILSASGTPQSVNLSPEAGQSASRATSSTSKPLKPMLDSLPLHNLTPPSPFALGTTASRSSSNPATSTPVATASTLSNGLKLSATQSESGCTFSSRDESIESSPRHPRMACCRTDTSRQGIRRSLFGNATTDEDRSKHGGKQP
ncbi:mucin-19 isoform X2 [Dermacentor silvarum]|uniref:mucin-19 isoform X2 n=1 Tax=Dermacentor silvarum TaxID=543639 RepID=UPI002101780A|nr:mucin-19 isoform X2 [Dermacentor silvarum]